MRCPTCAGKGEIQDAPWTTGDVARALGMRTHSVAQNVRNGALRATRDASGTYRITAYDAVAFMAWKRGEVAAGRHP